MAMAIGAFCAYAEPETMTVTEMVNDNPTLEQGALSEGTYILAQKWTYGANIGTVKSTAMTVIAAGPDVMFVQDAGQQNLIAVERAEGMPSFNTVYSAGSVIPQLEVRYKANYITRNGAQYAIPYSIFVGEQYAAPTSTTTLGYSETALGAGIVSTTYGRIKFGLSANSYTEQKATWNATDGVFETTYTANNNEYPIRIHVKQMGVDTSNLLEGTYSIYAQGVMHPTQAGFDIYPNQVLQYTPIDVDNIAGLYALQSTLTSQKTSINVYNLKSKVKINAVSATSIFIEDETGGFQIQSQNANTVNFTNFGIKAGDYVQGLSFKLYYNNYWTPADLYGYYEDTTFPTPDGFAAVTYPLVTAAQLKADDETYHCKPVKVENVRVLGSTQKFENISINPSVFMSGFAFNPKKLYTIEGMYMNSYTIQTISAVETGDVAPIAPIKVANLEELKAAAETANFENNISKEIYKVTGKVGILHKTSYMFVQDAEAAMMVQSNSSTSMTGNGYVNGNVAEGLTVRLMKYNDDIRAYFDVDECEWPAVIAGETYLPQIMDADDIDASYEYRWVRTTVTATSTSAFLMNNLHTVSKPNDPASVSCTNNYITDSRPSIKKDNKYIMTGIFVGNHAATGNTTWNFYSTSYELAPDSKIDDVDDIEALTTAVKDLKEGETTPTRYRLGPAYVTVRTSDKIFVQTGSDGMIVAAKDENGNLKAFNYEYGDIVNGLVGYVKKVNGVPTLLVDHTAFNASTMNMAMLIPVEEIEIEDIENYKHVMVKVRAEIKTPEVAEEPETPEVEPETPEVDPTEGDENEPESIRQKENEESFKLGNLNLVGSGVLNADGADMPWADKNVYTFTGVSDGENFYPYSAEFSHNTGIETISTESKQVKDIYTIDGMRTNALRPGINIIRLNDGTTIKVIK